MEHYNLPHIGTLGSIHTYIHTYIQAYMHTSIHPYMHTCIHTCIHTYIHTCIHVCIHAYMYTCIPYIHTYIIHTYILLIARWRKSINLLLGRESSSSSSSSSSYCFYMCEILVHKLPSWNCYRLGHCTTHIHRKIRADPHSPVHMCPPEPDPLPSINEWS